MIVGAPQSTMVQLRSGSRDDLDAVMRVMDGAFDPRFGEAWTRPQCAGILPMTGVVLTIAGSRDPVGFSLHRTVIDEAELLLLAVAPDARGQGIGRMLLDRFLEDASSVGARRVHLEMRANNPASSMYHAAGFQLAGRRKDYYSGENGERFDALTFVRELEVQ